MAQRPAIGDPASLFSAPAAGGEYSDGDIVDPSDPKGEFVVLYFYPQMKPAELVEELLSVPEPA